MEYCASLKSRFVPFSRSVVLFDEQRDVGEIREAEETQINVRFVMFGFRFWFRIGYIRCDYDYMSSALIFRSTSKAYSPYEIQSQSSH
jgi:hypothetical protein